VKIAYVDTEAGPTPPAIGQISGTPTIKAFVPRRDSANNAKSVVDYDQAREVGDLMRFAVGRMPNFVEALADENALLAFARKSAEWQLPRVLVFSDKSGGTSSILKALSAEFRRRVLIAELKKAKHASAVKAYQISSFPSLVCLSPAREDGGDVAAGESEVVRERFEKKEPSFHRLNGFIGRCALKKPVLKKPAAKEKPAGGKEEL